MTFLNCFLHFVRISTLAQSRKWSDPAISSENMWVNDLGDYFRICNGIVNERWKIYFNCRSIQRIHQLLSDYIYRQVKEVYRIYFYPRSCCETKNSTQNSQPWSCYLNWQLIESVSDVDTIKFAHSSINVDFSAIFTAHSQSCRVSCIKHYF